MEYDIFVSYSRKDSAVVQSVVDRLKAEGYCCWMDVTGIESSDEFKRVLVKAIRHSKVVLFFSSANSNNTEWTVKEINIAVQMKKPIIPVRLDDAPYDDSILFDLSGLDYIPCQDATMNVSANDKLMRAVVKHCGIVPKGEIHSCDSTAALSPKFISDRGGVKRTNIKWLCVLSLLVSLLICMLIPFVFRHFDFGIEATGSECHDKSDDSWVMLADENEVRDEILKWPVNLCDEEGIVNLTTKLCDLKVLEQDWKRLNNISDSNIIEVIRFESALLEDVEREIAMREMQVKMLEAESQSVDHQLDNEIKSSMPVFKLGQ